MRSARKWKMMSGTREWMVCCVVVVVWRRISACVVRSESQLLLPCGVDAF